jgi:Zn-dependent oligopeptidase
MTATQQADELTGNLVPKINELTYHYTAKQQARYLKESKENLQSSQSTILAYYSEKYSFTLQDAVLDFNEQIIKQFFMLPLFISEINTCKLCPSV